MKFLDANGLALFTKKIFNKFVSNVSGADNKITITKGDGTKNEINLNEVLKTDEIAENPPEDDNTLKIPSTSWVQSFLNYLFSIESANTDNIKSKIKSWAQEQINSWLETLGIRYNIAQNGYICLGKLFGDAIIQWGLLILKKDHAQEPDSNYVQESLNLPISLKIVVCGISTCNVLINTYCYIHATLPTLTIGRNPYNTDTKHYYLIVGK